jgi:hypothetical protein
MPMIEARVQERDKACIASPEVMVIAVRLLDVVVRGGLTSFMKLVLS